MSAAEIVIGIAVGLLVNEFCDLSPWAARKIVVWSAHMWYGKSQRAEIRADELTALIDARPGKLFKLLTALRFALAALLIPGRAFAVFLLSRVKLSIRIAITLMVIFVIKEPVLLIFLDGGQYINGNNY